MFLKLTCKKVLKQFGQVGGAVNAKSPESRISKKSKLAIANFNPVTTNEWVDSLVVTRSKLASHR
jgi:hypothetical protein